ncbi:uroporphyrinogen-III synthase [Sphingomonas sp. MA1305]|uniref:uroporphyrinogen-III synthase n=1 Tax=Sphingomonas sp. MA1305 TaxID=2479204 RepID=UPI0018DF94EC|nr:uroporphyrinogen-III synthase [Sphingomonas sp. MA1305]MBI0475619.1 uroporphyrinogen-III synthase [Sphingomonas sp. MA1305]
MTRALVVRPEPGNAATVARLRTLGVEAQGWPLFAVAPVGWLPPDPADFDSLLVTSAQAIRHAGPGLARLAALPVIAVGPASAAAARAAGLRVAAMGEGDAVAALAAGRAGGLIRPLHLAGRDHVTTGCPTIVVYASDAVPVDARAFAAAADGAVVLLHSARAASRVAALIPPARRGAVALAAISPAVLAAAGAGWGRAAASAVPDDGKLCVLAQAIDRAGPGGDKGP